MTLKTDHKKRLVLPDAAPGDVFGCHQTSEGMLLKRIYRQLPKPKKTKAQVLKAIGNWKNVPQISWKKLRAITREA